MDKETKEYSDAADLIAQGARYGNPNLARFVAAKVFAPTPNSASFADMVGKGLPQGDLNSLDI